MTTTEGDLRNIEVSSQQYSTPKVDQTSGEENGDFEDDHQI